MLGRRLKALYPVVPLARRQALGIAIMSYDGHLGFGLLADYDALEQPDLITKELRRAIKSLARAAGVDGKSSAKQRPSSRRKRATVAKTAAAAGKR